MSDTCLIPVFNGNVCGRTGLGFSQNGFRLLQNQLTSMWAFDVARSKTPILVIWYVWV